MKLRIASLAAVSLLVSSAHAQTVDPFYAGAYTYTDLGSVPGVLPNYGGLTLLAGSSNTLLIGGSANSAAGTLYAIGVTRDAQGHIVAFNGTASIYGDAAYNDGGLCYGPGGVLFASRWPVNELGQYRPGSTTPDRIIDLAALGSAYSHSAVQFVPAGYPSPGRMKLCSWSGGQFYDAVYTADGLGTYNVVSLSHVATLGGGPEGFTYVPAGSPLFPGPAMIVSEYSAGNVAVYDVDANGDPIVSSRRDFIVGLSGAEGAFIDPLTGDFLFSTFGGGSRVIVVSGFASVPGACSIADIATEGNPDVQAGPDGFITGVDADAFIECFNNLTRRSLPADPPGGPYTGPYIADVIGDLGVGPPNGFIEGYDADAFFIAFFLGC